MAVLRVFSRARQRLQQSGYNGFGAVLGVNRKIAKAFIHWCALGDQRIQSRICGSARALLTCISKSVPTKSYPSALASSTPMVLLPTAGIPMSAMQFMALVAEFWFCRGLVSSAESFKL